MRPISSAAGWESAGVTAFTSKQRSRLAASLPADGLAGCYCCITTYVTASALNRGMANFLSEMCLWAHPCCPSCVGRKPTFTYRYEMNKKLGITQRRSHGNTDQTQQGIMASAYFSSFNPFFSCVFPPPHSPSFLSQTAHSFTGLFHLPFYWSPHLLSYIFFSNDEMCVSEWVSEWVNNSLLLSITFSNKKKKTCLVLSNNSWLTDTQQRWWLTGWRRSFDSFAYFKNTTD